MLSAGRPAPKREEEAGLYAWFLLPNSATRQVTGE